MSLEGLLLACQVVLVSPSLKIGLSISAGERLPAGSVGMDSSQKSQWDVSVDVCLENVSLTACCLVSFPLDRFSDMT